MGLIELQGVSKAFFVDRKKAMAKVALDSLDLSIAEGEFVSLVGPSGCGKTVSLNLMTDFDVPTLGKALFKGKPIEKPGAERGVVFQEYSLFPWLSVRDNVEFSIRNAVKAAGRRLSQSEIAQRSTDALAVVGLSDVAGARPNTLSGGMKQRVAIARLLAMDSEVFLMDEPFSALDEQTRRALDESLRHLWQRKGKTVVFVTHNISEAVLMSSRIVLFSNSPGKIIGEWHIDDGFDRDPAAPAFTALGDEIRSCMPLSSCEFALDQD